MLRHSVEAAGREKSALRLLFPFVIFVRFKLVQTMLTFLGGSSPPPPLIPLDEKSTYPIVFYKVGDDFADSIAAVVNGQLRQLPAILQREGAAGEGMLSWSHPLC